MSDPRTAWTSHWQRYLTHYPVSEPCDLYKFAHQGIRGAEHAIHDVIATRTRLDAELAAVAAATDGTMAGATFGARGDVGVIEELPPDARFVRVHLRAFVQHGGDVDALFDAFLATAQDGGASGDAREVVDAFRHATDALTQREIGALLGGVELSVDAVLAYFTDAARDGYPARHHSVRHRDAYRPAYRVLSRARALRLVRGSAT